MCECKNITAGSYDNQIELPRPNHMVGQKEGTESNTICVDTCLKSEILDLWSKGISTTGCCCGHNYLPPYIGVIDSDINKMLNMGYEVQPNHLYPERRDGFKPKTI